MKSRTISTTEAARLLKVSEATLERWVREGVIPSLHQGTVSCFDPAHLVIWARDKGIHVTGGEQSSQTTAADIKKAIERGGVHHSFYAPDVKKACFSVAEHLLICKEWSDGKKTLLGEKLFEREQQISTAIGNQVAILHPSTVSKWDENEPSIGFFFLKEGIDWGSPDNQLVKVLLVLLSTTIANHLMLLSQITKWLNASKTQQLLHSTPNCHTLLEGIENAPLV